MILEVAPSEKYEENTMMRDVFNVEMFSYELLLVIIC